MPTWCAPPGPSGRPGWSRSTRRRIRWSTSPGDVYAGEGVDIAAQIAAVKESLGLGMHATGSNNWVVSGERSVTGQAAARVRPAPDVHEPGPLVRGRPRLRRLPRARRHPADEPVSRVRAERAFAAWGFTNVMADTQDLFVERLNPDDARMYEFEGEWRQAEVVREEIQVKGRGTPEALDVTVTHHGPIVSDALGAAEPARAVVDRAPVPARDRLGLQDQHGAQRAGDHRGSGDPPRAAAQPAVGGPRRQHRVPARGQGPAAQGQRAGPAQARLDRGVRMGRNDSLRRAAARGEPAARASS